MSEKTVMIERVIKLRISNAELNNILKDTGLKQNLFNRNLLVKELIKSDLNMRLEGIDWTPIVKDDYDWRERENVENYEKED